MRMTVLTAVLVCAAPACGGDPEPAPPPEGVVVTAEDVTFGGLLGQIRGHHRVAVELYRAGEKPSATIHSGHPIAEILNVVEGRIREAEAAAADGLKQALAAVAKVIADGQTPERLSAAVDDATKAVERAETAVIGGDRTSVAYRASIVGSLLLTSAGEYGEAVRDGAVHALIEFQDAYAFLSVAKEIYTGVEARVKRVSAKKAEEIARAFGTLNRALPGVKPRASVTPIGDVERAASDVGQRLEDTVQAFAVDYLRPEKAFENIDQLLAELVTEYEKGRRKEAAALAGKAYLENYERVEAEVIRLDNDLNAELEPLLSDVLVEKILGNVPVDELKALVTRLRALVKRARDVVL